MFPVKREPPVTFNEGTDSQRIRCIDDNPDISDTLNTDASDNLLDNNFRKEMLLTIAYVENESKSHAFGYTCNTSNCKGNECIHRQQLTDINVIKTEKTETCSDNTSGNVTDHEHVTIQAKEKYQHNDIIEDSNNHVTDISRHYMFENEEHGTMHAKEKSHRADISQQYRVGGSYAIDIGNSCTSNATQSRAKTHKQIQKRVNQGENSFKCDLCSYSVGQYSNLKKHKLIHSGEKPFNCNLCDYRTTRYGSLKSHKLIHSGEKPFKCDLCDYSATQSGALKTHKMIHLGEKPYKCDECGFSTTRSRNLNTHKLIHSGEKPFKCSLCEYSTAHYGYLKTHELIHSGKKPYKCDLCDYSTAWLRALKTHKLIHTGEKPYKCDICDYCTTQSGNLRAHRLMHSEEKPFKCSLCEYNYRA